MNIQDRFKQITTFIFDVDGVLTDGTVLLLENGLQARTMHIKDGYALQLAVKKGYRLIVVSGADSTPVIGRMNRLGITEVHLSVADKKNFIEKFMKANGVKEEEILFMGDDIPDLPAMGIVGLPSCPADAVPEIRQAARYVSSHGGGSGCVRDVIEIVLKLNDDWGHEAGVASR
jgi:3-deoxy-D-manno-octulosonate 8-phosphate phosphatase (KDO 8-P phosphatase)